ncbi:MAG TPA: hypothetical protein VM032_17070 [Vicinamibacterales bacterium]|nr:hypothetical protein [Vicinamibacterales bacterium]
MASVSACELTKTENPLSPSVAGPIAGVEISAPKLLEPASGAQIPGDRQPITLLIENSYSTGPRPLQYSFEVATDSNFNNIVFVREGVTPGENGRTALTLPNSLGTGRGYFWRAKAQDGANTGPYSSMVAFNLFTPVAFDKPAPISPVGGVKVASYTPEFIFTNAPRTGTPGLVTYVIEVATAGGFANVIAAWQFPEQPGQTRFTAPSGLPGASQLYWRVRAFEASALGPWSDHNSFVTPTPTAPSGGGGTGGGGGGSCNNNSQLGIVTCRRNQFNGKMDAGQVIVFLKGVAGDLNKAGTWGTGYGLLRKTSGSSCGGYSCDIICQGSTLNSQKQYDVLIDSDGAQGPIWGGPKTYPDIRFDSCDVP